MTDCEGFLYKEAYDYRMFQFGCTKLPVALNWRNSETDMPILKCKKKRTR